MYFSDEIGLLAVTYTYDDIGQSIATETSKTVYCDLQSVSGNESSLAGQRGIHAEARAVMCKEDYSGEDRVRVGNDTILNPGTYTVYRTYYNDKTVELYLTEKVDADG